MDNLETFSEPREADFEIWEEELEARSCLVNDKVGPNSKVVGKDHI